MIDRKEGIARSTVNAVASQINDCCSCGHGEGKYNNYRSFLARATTLQAARHQDTIGSDRGHARADADIDRTETKGTKGAIHVGSTRRATGTPHTKEEIPCYRHVVCERRVWGRAPCFILRVCHSSSPAITTDGEAEKADHTLAETDKGMIRLK